MRISYTLILTALLQLSAASAHAHHLSSDAELIQLFEFEDDYYAARSAVVADVTLSDEVLEGLSIHPDWRVRTQAEIVLGWRHHSELFRQIEAAVSVAGRQGRIHRFMDEAFLQPLAAPAILERLLHGDDVGVVGAALAHSLVGLVDHWGEDMIGILGASVSTDVSVAAVAAFRWAEEETGLAGLRLALRQPEPRLREIAASVAAWRSDGLELASDLRTALEDDHAPTRAMAARALGYLRDLHGASALQLLLDDPSADVRLHALRSLDRVAPSLAEAELRTGRLSGEKDERVLRVQRRIRTR